MQRNRRIQPKLREKKSQEKQNHRQPSCDYNNFKISIINVFKHIYQKMNKMGKEMMNFRGDRSSKKGPNGNPRIKNIVSEIKKINWMKLKAG